MKYLSFLLSILLLACQPQAEKNDTSVEQNPLITSNQAPFPTQGSIDYRDSSLSQYLSEGSTQEVLASGFTWSEGPLWVKSQNYLIFSDVPQNIAYRFQEGKGVDIFLQPSGFTQDAEGSSETGSNGLTLDREGNLVLCQHGDRRVARMDASWKAPESKFQTITDRFDGKKFNSPNDLVFSPSGNLYFTDPPYGLNGQDDDPAKELSHNGVYLYSSTGELTLEIDSLTRPNGIAISPDGRTLYVANSDPKKAYWMAYDLDEAGHVSSGKILVDATAWVGDEYPGYPDGLKIHPDGTLFATGPGGVWVIQPDGKHLGIIRPGAKVANCAFGNGYLYMTAHQNLMRIPVLGLN